MKKCFFIGHRDVSEKILPLISAEIERLIEECGVTEFVVGRYGSFDSCAARALASAKRAHPEISVRLLLPYYSEKAAELPEGFDGSVFPPGLENTPRRYAIVKANRYMVDHSEYLIAYAHHSASNSSKLVEYAEKRERRGLISVKNLAENEI